MPPGQPLSWQELDQLHEQLWFAVVADPAAPLTTIREMNEAKEKLDKATAEGDQGADEQAN